MASAAPSGSAGAGGGGGDTGGGQQQPSSNRKRPRLQDVVSTVASQIVPYVSGSHQLNAALYRRECFDEPDEIWDKKNTLMATFTRHRFQRPGALTVTVRRCTYPMEPRKSNDHQIFAPSLARDALLPTTARVTPATAVVL